jgi:hypothetical protein
VERREVDALHSVVLERPNCSRSRLLPVEAHRAQDVDPVVGSDDEANDVGLDLDRLTAPFANARGHD